MKIHITSNSLRKIATSAIFCLIAIPSSAAILTHLINIFPGQGKIATYQFRFREDFGVTSITWSPNGRFIADTGLLTQTMNVWSIPDRKLAHHFEFNGWNDGHRAAAFSPDSRLLAFCDGMGTLRVFQTSDWQEIHTQGEPRKGFCFGRVAYSSDGGLLAFQGSDSFKVLDTSSWTFISPTVPQWLHGTSINAFEFIPNTHELVLAGGSYPAKGEERGYEGAYWKFALPRLSPSNSIAVYQDYGGPAVRSMAVSHDGLTIATGTITGNGSPPRQVTDAVRFFKVSSNELIAKVLENTEVGNQASIDFSSDDKILAVAAGGIRGPCIYLINALNFTVMDSFDPGNTVYDVEFEPNGERLAAGVGGDVIIYSLRR